MQVYEPLDCVTEPSLDAANFSLIQEDRLLGMVSAGAGSVVPISIPYSGTNTRA